MPSDFELWVTVVGGILFVGVSYYSLMMIRSARKRIRAIEETTESFTQYFGAMKAQLDHVQKEASGKVSAADLESKYAALLSKVLRKKWVVKNRG